MLCERVTFVIDASERPERTANVDYPVSAHAIGFH
jgi:hypothetical protein